MTSSDFSAVLPLVIVAGSACVLLIVDLFVPHGQKGITGLLAAVALSAALAEVLIQSRQPQQAFGGMILADGFAAFLQSVFLIAGIAGIALAYDYLRRMGIERGEYYALMMFVIGGMMLMSMAGDLIVVFLGLETLSIPLYVLAGFARPRLDSEESALKYFILGAFASSFEVYGIALVFGAAHTTGFQGIVQAVQQAQVDRVLLLIGAVLILVSLGFKVAAVPFHMWTPDVYQGAPSPVTAFMSVAVKAAGFAALLRVFLVAFPGLAAEWMPTALALSALTMIWGNIAAITQSNIKRLLAYSSIAHAGYILMALPAAAVGRVAPEAISGALFYLLAYAVTNLGAWGVVVAVESAEGKGLLLDDYAGLGTRRPALALAMAVFMFSLTGVPPTIGFIGKFYLFRAVLDAGLVWLAILGVVTSLISAYYYLRVVVVMYMRPGEPAVRSEGWLNLTVGLMALGTFVFGLLPGPLLALASRAGFWVFGP